MGKSKKENKRNNIFSILGILGKKGQGGGTAPTGGGVKKPGMAQEWVTCDECHGSGWVNKEQVETSGGPTTTIRSKCPKCGGKGRIIDDKKWMQTAKKAGKVAGVAGGIAKGVGGAAKGFAGSLSGAGGGGGSIDFKKIAIFLFIGGIIILIGFWFLAVGGGQAVLPGISGGLKSGWDNIMNSYSIRSFINLVKNPFGVGPTGGEYEGPGGAVIKTPPNQAFSIELRGVTETVILDQSSIIAIVKVNNLGSSKIERVDVNVDLRSPYAGCITFDLGEGGNKRTITDIAPFSSKEIVFSGGIIHSWCIVEYLGTQDKLKEGVSIGGIVITANARTYYPTSSRLAVERINTDYGVLLIKNNLLRQQKTGAIYRTGSAMTIDMDVGAQPIFDTITQTALLLKWQNVGSGKMINEKTDVEYTYVKNDDGIKVTQTSNKVIFPPFLFIITPAEFGKCRPSGYVESTIGCGSFGMCIACDSVLWNEWCQPDSLLYKTYISRYAGDTAPLFNWVCNQALSGNVHVCGTSSLTEEFNVFSCTLNLPGAIKTNETRVTDYITTIALYPYEMGTSKSIKAFCLSDTSMICTP